MRRRLRISHPQARLLDLLQDGFPLTRRPFLSIGKSMRRSEDWVLTNLGKLMEEGVVREISGIFDSRKLGFVSTLVAMKLPARRVDLAGKIVSREPGVSHNYRRDHEFNLWFTVTADSQAALTRTLGKLRTRLRPERILVLPSLRVFKIGVSFDMSGGKKTRRNRNVPSRSFRLTSFDTKLVVALQRRIVPVRRPFESAAREFDIEEGRLIAGAKELIRKGFMRRFGAVLRHRNAGFAANAMTAWKIPKNDVDAFGRIASSFPQVSHCYERPVLRGWPYSVFVMIHGRTKRQCKEVMEGIADKTGARDYEILYSTKEYKKERVRYFVQA
ncbi:MAG: Lrp/AsnC family transcriptional regulator [Candidatus Eisenbacteria bacterium]|nr:Lrp/AsnC family transcriptional regulator [Candidatus Eisenbacteria bacterium]